MPRVDSEARSCDQDSPAPPDRFCDLVMKGGITSGIVYPPAISALANVYCLKNIGGTSAGAIAAAVTAAAEFRRRKTGKMGGFELLEALPRELGETDARGRTRLLRLFQPDKSCRRLFRILVGSLNAKSTLRRVAAIVFSAIASYWLASLVGIGMTFALYLFTHCVTAAVLGGVLALPGLVGFRIYRELTHTLVENNYGMCRGLTTQASDGDALTPWLHDLIQRAAGLPPEEPLTFGHLWSAPGGPPRAPSANDRAGRPHAPVRVCPPMIVAESGMKADARERPGRYTTITG